MSASIVLVCAVLASMAAGVLLAYGLCQALFAVFYSRARQRAEKQGLSVAPPRTVEG